MCIIEYIMHTFEIYYLLFANIFNPLFLIKLWKSWNTYPKIFSNLLSGHWSKSIENYVYVGQRNRPVWYIFEIILATMAKLLFVMLLALLIRLLRMFFENIFFNWRDSAVLSSIIFNAAEACRKFEWKFSIAAKYGCLSSPSVLFEYCLYFKHQYSTSLPLPHPLLLPSFPLYISTRLN